MLSAALHTELTAPNNKTWKQPLGLFINNEFVEGSGGTKITSVNPQCVSCLLHMPHYLVRH